MTLDAQVVSLALAQQLKAAGVPQESYFSWARCPDFSSSEYATGAMRLVTGYGHPLEPIENYAAFTVAELGVLLPDGYFSYRRGHRWCIDAREVDQNGWIGTPVVIYDEFDTEADCRAKMLLHLIEHKLVTIPEARRA